MFKQETTLIFEEKRLSLATVRLFWWENAAQCIAFPFIIQTVWIENHQNMHDGHLWNDQRCDRNSYGVLVSNCFEHAYGNGGLLYHVRNKCIEIDKTGTIVTF